jgi:uncharacterized protein (TIGR02145 family)
MKTIYCLFLVVTCISVSCKKESDSNISIKDIEGNVYQTVRIGTQVWTMENLKTTKYNDGSSIPFVPDDGEWQNLSTPGFSWYDNDSINYKNTLGALYNWNAINTGKLAPVGWHVATDADWIALTTFLGGDSIAGGKLKEKGTDHWATPNKGATNASGFTGLPAGYREPGGEFMEIDQSGNWWSSSSSTTDNAYFRGIGYNRTNITRSVYNKRYGFSVRCVKN